MPRLAFRAFRPWAAPCLLLTLALPLAARQPSAAAAEPARVTYSKSFRGSTPTFLEITIQRNGPAQYQTVEKAGEPPRTFTFTASSTLVARVFQLARKLHYFVQPRLESKAKVGYMGTKMLAYDDDGHHAQQTFNYTSNAAAAELNGIFERISTTGEHVAHLHHLLRYDRLGVVQELDGITQDWSARQMLAPEMLRPLLQKVAEDASLMHIARRRANDLLAAMRTDPLH